VGDRQLRRLCQGVYGHLQPTREGTVVGWIIVLCVVAVVLIGARIWDRRRRRRESLGGSPDQWKVEHRAGPGGPADDQGPYF
jgi:hypothetical protein